MESGWLKHAETGAGWRTKQPYVTNNPKSHLLQSPDSIAMEQKLLSDFQQVLNFSPLSLKPFSLCRSLVVNPSTSDHTISSIIQTLETLTKTTTNTQFYLLHVITLLGEISVLRHHLSSHVTTILHSLSVNCPKIPPCDAGLALSTLLSIFPASCSQLVPAVSDMTEGLFLSLCFAPCVPLRHRLLLDTEKFEVRPSVLLTVLLGFTKDPYPYVRMAALDGLVGLCKCIVVEDRGMVEGCYFRAVELLFDTEECVRCSAVHMVSEMGKYLVASSVDKTKIDWSDASYVQLCSMVRDMSVNVRIEAFRALGKVGMVSEYILMQTLSKKVLPITKEKKFRGQLSGSHISLPASSAAGAFIHGLEDEFYEVRSCACYSLRMPGVLSADFAAGALNLLMDVLNDDSAVVRLQALETLHHMAVLGHLKVQETHMHMFLGTLVDNDSSIRFKARKVLGLTMLHDLPMFMLAVDSLIQSLDMYPQDEPDVLSVIFDIGRNHGGFAVSIIKETLLEIEPSSGTNWDFNSSKTAAHLVLAIAAPLSQGKQKQLNDIPPIIFSYAVTMLGRISQGLAGVMNQDTLLAYLSSCSRSTGDKMVQIVDDDQSTEVNCQITSSVGLDTVHKSNGDSETVPHVVDQFEVHDKADNYVKFFFADIGDLWPLIKSGCTSEVLMKLRSWKEELATFVTPSDSVLTFTLQYLHVVKLLSKAWMHVMHPIDFIHNELGDLRYILQKLEKRLKQVRYRFTRLSKEEESHINELSLCTYTLRLSTLDTSCHKCALKKSLLVYEDRSVKPSQFVIELMKTFEKNGSDRFCFQQSLEFFSLNHFAFSGNMRYMKAEMDIANNDWLNPLPFVPGLPVGIPLKITLHNTPIETTLWLMMTQAKHSKQYFFVDLKHFEGCEKAREFTFIAPFYRTPKVSSFILRLCIGMECLSEQRRRLRGPKHEVVWLCKEKQVFLSMVVKRG